MSIFKCEMCGGTLEIEDNGKFAVCEYCGTRQAVPQSENTNFSVENSQSDTPAKTNNNAQAEINRFENERKAEEARARAQEARVKAEENRLKAESQRLERERLAEKKRSERSKRLKKLWKKLITVFLSFSAVVALIVLTVTVIIPSVKYSGAIKDIEEKNYEEAYLTFKSLGMFKDSREQAKNLLKDHPDIAQVGDIIRLGEYEQDNKTSNGKEELEWKVLEKDENGNMLVISLHAIDCRRYHSSVEQVSWETSEIRKWLNNDFITTAFTDSQKSKIKTVTIKNTDNSDYKTDGGNDTKDKVFLLSIDEAKQYMPSVLERICLATAYAEAQGSELESLTKACRWWLRSPGAVLYNASFVKIDGFILQYGSSASLDKCSVRPAMWVDF